MNTRALSLRIFILHTFFFISPEIGAQRKAANPIQSAAHAGGHRRRGDVLISVQRDFHLFFVDTFMNMSLSFVQLFNITTVKEIVSLGNTEKIAKVCMICQVNIT